MEENTGSILQLIICNANQYKDLILKPNSMANILEMEEGFTAIIIPMTIDTGEYNYSDKDDKPSKTHSFTVKCSLPFNSTNKAIIDSLPNRKLLIIKDYEGRYLTAGSKQEPFTGKISLKTDPDFSKGKFYQLEFSRQLKIEPLFITNSSAQQVSSVD